MQLQPAKTFAKKNWPALNKRLGRPALPDVSEQWNKSPWLQLINDSAYSVL